MARPGWVRGVEGAAHPGSAGSWGQAALGKGWSEGRGRALEAREPPLQQSGQPGCHLSQGPPLTPVLLGPQSSCGWTPGRAGGQRCPGLSRLPPARSCFRAASSFCLFRGHHLSVPGRTRRPAGAPGLNSRGRGQDRALFLASGS